MTNTSPCRAGKFSQPQGESYVYSKKHEALYGISMHEWSGPSRSAGSLRGLHLHSEELMRHIRRNAVCAKAGLENLHALLGAG
jgi:hypothetical protein